ncbi:MAG: hypothetical protein CMH98_09995 [Oceanospirillaceae bacterium]|nr:hypothetical protein [Oceanospirillaceae bacterium]|tara:strand:- start:22066 stop:23160 length:1095 start_codon:yes stop_codon:yes gene_type:complete
MISQLPLRPLLFAGAFSLTVALSACGGSSSSHSDSGALNYVGEEGEVDLSQLTDEQVGDLAAQVEIALGGSIVLYTGDQVTGNIFQGLYEQADDAEVEFPPLTGESGSEETYSDSVTVYGNCNDAPGAAEFSVEGSGHRTVEADTDNPDQYEEISDSDVTTSINADSLCVSSDGDVTLTGTDTYRYTDTTEATYTMPGQQYTSYKNDYQAVEEFNYSPLTVAGVDVNISGNFEVSGQQIGENNFEENQTRHITISYSGQSIVVDGSVYVKEDADTDIREVTNLYRINNTTYRVDGMLPYIDIYIPDYGKVGVDVSQSSPCGISQPSHISSVDGEAVVYNGDDSFTMTYNQCGADAEVSDVSTAD